MNKLTKYACILTTLAGAVACSGGKKAQGDYAIIPLPQEVVTQGSAPFLLKPSTPISYQEGDAEMEQTARFLASYVKEATGYEPKVITGNADKGIHLSIASDIRNPEGYRLLVSENGIEIAGASTPVFSMACRPCVSLSPPWPKEWTSNFRPPVSTTIRVSRIAVCTSMFPGTSSR